MIGPYVINAMGARAARRYFLTGERFDAQEARRLGLVHQVVPHTGLDDAVATMLDTLGQGGPCAQGAAKRLIAEIAGRPVDSRMRRHTAERIAGLRASAEGKEGLDAFLNKRAPAWRDGAKD
jgi:methylglutaconyl-CoA hydratase